MFPGWMFPWLSVLKTQRTRTLLTRELPAHASLNYARSPLHQHRTRRHRHKHRLRALVVTTSGGPAYALFSKTNARGPAHAPFLNNEARSVYFSPRDGCSLGGWARRPLLSLETRARQFTRACCNYVWWPSVRTFLRYECTGPGARCFSQGRSLCPWVAGPSVAPFL